MNKKTMTISELVESAKESGFSLKPRTIHFYTSEGLLPPLIGSGGGARYDEVHLLHLLLIKKFQKQHYKLSEIGKQIKAKLHGMTKEQKHALLERLSIPKETVPVRDVQDLDHYLYSAHSEVIASRKALQNAAENSQQGTSDVPSDGLSVSYLDWIRKSPTSAKPEQSSQSAIPPHLQDQAGLSGVGWIKFSPQEGVEVQVREDILSKNRGKILLWLAEYASTNAKGDRHEY